MPYGIFFGSAPLRDVINNIASFHRLGSFSSSDESSIHSGSDSRFFPKSVHPIIFYSSPKSLHSFSPHSHLLFPSVVVYPRRLACWRPSIVSGPLLRSPPHGEIEYGCSPLWRCCVVVPFIWPPLRRGVPSAWLQATCGVMSLAAHLTFFPGMVSPVASP